MEKFLNEISEFTMPILILTSWIGGFYFYGFWIGFFNIFIPYIFPAVYIVKEIL